MSPKKEKTTGQEAKDPTNGEKGKLEAAAKTAAAQNVPVGKLTIEHIDDKTLVLIITKLEEMRDESLAIVNHDREEGHKPWEDTHDVGDDLDQAANERDREFNLIMHQRHLKRLNQIEEAFDRIKDGSFGLCEGTDEPINPKRLMIMPLAKYSLEYQEQQEKMMGRAIEGAYGELDDSAFDSDE